MAVVAGTDECRTESVGFDREVTALARNVANCGDWKKFVTGSENAVAVPANPRSAIVETML